LLKMSERNNKHPQLARLIQIVSRLRAPGGCPWDREQTEATMAPHLLEEACEAVDAIERGDARDSCEELGDVLMNVLMISQISSEHGGFDLEDVAHNLADKLVRRHPHVFPPEGEAVTAEDAAQVLRNREAIKRQEKASKGDSNRVGVLSGVPAELPSLLKAHRVGEKAAQVGFDWPDQSGAREKLAEELEELDRALQEKDQEAVAREVGDSMFSLVNLARHIGVNAEMALRGTIRRFVTRFERVEKRLGPDLEKASMEDLEAAWQSAKKQE
jgi:MazG family protein